MTDGLPAYRHLGQAHGGVHRHHTVIHSQRVFARTDAATGMRVHTNTAESWASLLERAVVAVFHPLSPKHLNRYVAEASHRWNTRGQHVRDRMRRLVGTCGGTRLSFKSLVEAPA